jgi:hypothetical protein
MEVGLSGGILSFQDQQLVLYRNGIAEDVWMNLDYSPIRDERRASPRAFLRSLWKPRLGFRRTGS